MNAVHPLSDSSEYSSQLSLDCSTCPFEGTQHCSPHCARYRARCVGVLTETRRASDTRERSYPKLKWSEKEIEEIIKVCNGLWLLNFMDRFVRDVKATPDGKKNHLVPSLETSLSWRELVEESLLDRPLQAFLDSEEQTSQNFFNAMVHIVHTSQRIDENVVSSVIEACVEEIQKEVLAFLFTYLVQCETVQQVPENIVLAPHNFGSGHNLVPPLRAAQRLSASG